MAASKSEISGATVVKISELKTEQRVEKYEKYKQRMWWREENILWWFYDFQALNVCWWPIYYALYDPLWIDYKLTSEHALSHSPLAHALAEIWIFWYFLSVILQSLGNQSTLLLRRFVSNDRRRILSTFNARRLKMFVYVSSSRCHLSPMNLKNERRSRIRW